MTDIVFYFQVHQPFRLRKYSFFDIGKGFNSPSASRLATCHSTSESGVMALMPTTRAPGEGVPLSRGTEDLLESLGYTN